MTTDNASAPLLVADRDQISRYIKRLLRRADPGTFFHSRAFLEGRENVFGAEAFPVNAASHEHIIDGVDAMATRAAQAHSKVVHAPIPSTFAAGASAKVGSTANGLAILVECDSRPAEAREALESVLGPVSMAVASGGEWVDPADGTVHDKLHLYWMLTVPSRTVEEHARVRLGRELACDLAGADRTSIAIVHPVRVPGSWHRKTDRPRLCRIVAESENEVEIEWAIARLNAACLMAGVDRSGGDGSPRISAALQAELPRVAAALDVIPNSKYGWDDWNPLMMAIYAATGGSDEGLALAQAWSAKNEGYNAEATEARWEHYHTSPPSKIGAGTLFHLAEKVQPGFMAMHNRVDAADAFGEAEDAPEGYEAPRAAGGPGFSAEDAPGAPQQSDADSTEQPPDPEWFRMLSVGKTGGVYGNTANAMLALKWAPELRDIFAFDQMANRVVMRRPIPIPGLYIKGDTTWPRFYTDGDGDTLQAWLQIQATPVMGKEQTVQAIHRAARVRGFHPVREMLNGLAWDGVPRISSWLTDCLGVVSSEYSRAVGRMFLIAMIARVFRPGCKQDYMLILEGLQGESKSTACRILAGRWFSANLPHDVSSKDAAAHLKGNWLIEVGELSALTKSESETMKEFLVRQVEKYRPSYGREEVEEPRQCVFVGTTNKQHYLRDETGARRYWPVFCHDIDLLALTACRDQLLAEATAAFKAGEQYWPTREQDRTVFKPEQDARFETDAWEEIILSYVEGTHTHNASPLKQVTVRDLLVLGVGLPDMARAGVTEGRRIAAIMARLGWSYRRPKGVDRPAVWVRSQNVVPFPGAQRV